MDRNYSLKFPFVHHQNLKNVVYNIHFTVKKMILVWKIKFVSPQGTPYKLYKKCKYLKIWSLNKQKNWKNQNLNTFIIERKNWADSILGMNHPVYNMHWYLLTDYFIHGQGHKNKIKILCSIIMEIKLRKNRWV